MITWKTLKYKHSLRAQEIAAGIKEGTVSEKDYIEFVAGLVESWDFIDAETGGPIRPGDYGELTLAQWKELARDFNQQMGAGVKKTKSANSSSGLTPSKPARTSSPRRRPGLIPS